MIRFNKFITLFLVFLALSVTRVFADDPSLTFSPSSVTPTLNQEFTIKIVLNSAGQNVSGAGAKLTYDQNYLRAVSIIPGTIFADYPSEIIDNRNGHVTISGIVASPKVFFNGESTFAEITFLPTKVGSTSVTFLYSPGSTTDSNIAVMTGTGDILRSINHLSVTTQNPGTAATSVSVISTPAPTPASVTSFFKGLINKIILFFNPNAKDKLASARDGRQSVQNIDPEAPLTRQLPNTDVMAYQPMGGGPKITSSSMLAYNLKMVLIFASTGIAVLIIIAVVLRRKNWVKP